MIRRSTWVLLVVLVVLGGLYWYLNRSPEEETAEPTPAVSLEYLFSGAEGEVTGIRVASREGDEVQVVRNLAGEWAMTRPQAAAADQGMVGAAAAQVFALRVLNRVGDIAPATVGLNNPAYTVTITFGDRMRTFAVGDMTPTGSGYYVMMDEEILVVDRPGVEALVQLASNPPYAPTPTASPAAPATSSP
ncbi:MAG: DUF4340 domain-containing protein [Anaerolineae bacterium]|nr:MAG: DUF4340 domain-containing protein [Anaerolineae bacterium]